MPFDSATIENKFNQLPTEVQTILTSQEIVDSISKIGESFGLHVDQIGILFQETTHFLLGLQSESEYESNIIGALNIDRTEADKILVELNQKVFLPIRSILQEQGTQPPASQPAMTKSSILNEIENPMPVEHPISLAKEVPAFPIAREVVSEKVPEKTSQAVAHDFINDKLTSMVNMPAQNTVVQPEKLPEKPKGYAADPYREPLI